MTQINAKRTARMAGVFFILATVASVVAAVFLGPILAKPDYLTAISQNQNMVVFAVWSMLVAVVSILGIAITLFPILRKQNENLAIWFFCARVFEAVFYMVAIVFLLSLLSLARTQTGSTELAALLRSMSDVAFNMGTLIVFSLSAVLLGIILYQSQLVPRWLSIWAIIGGLLLFVQGQLVVLDLSTASLEASLFVPIALNEMVLAIWLLTKGFNQRALAKL